MRRPFLTTLTTLAAVAVCASLAAPARAYVRSRSEDGKFDIIWPDPRITMTVHTGGAEIVPLDDFLAAAMGAAAAWSDPALGSSVAFTIAHSDDPPPGAAYDHENTISFRATWDDSSRYTSGELALTTVWNVDGRIVDADTEINALDPTWALLPDDPVAALLSSDVDLQAALTHELGHVLGLDHPCYLGKPPDPPEVTNEGAPVPSCADPALPDSVREATMYPSATPGSISERDLSPDELLALHDLYPAGAAPIVEAADAPAGGCAVAAGRGGPVGGAAAFGLAAAFAVARRRGRAASRRARLRDWLRARAPRG